MVFRTYVEKRQGLAPECEALLMDCRDFLGVQGLRAARIWNRYDVEGSRPLFEKCLQERVLRAAAGPCVRRGGHAGRLRGLCRRAPARSVRPARRQRSAVHPASEPRRSPDRAHGKKLYALYGMLTDADVEAVKRYVINPVESREASLAKPETLAEELAEPKRVASVESFTAMDEAALSALLSSMGLAMDIADLKALQDYFRETERRDPTVTELRVVDTYWSDHCRHTTFSTTLTRSASTMTPSRAPMRAILPAREEVYGAERGLPSARRRLWILRPSAQKTLKVRGLLPELRRERGDQRLLHSCARRGERQGAGLAF